MHNPGCRDYSLDLLCKCCSVCGQFWYPQHHPSSQCCEHFRWLAGRGSRGWAWELSLAIYYHYNKIFDPYNNGISGGSKPKSLDSKCSKLREMVRPKFCGLAQTLNEMKPNMPRIKAPLESEALLTFERIRSLLFEVFLKTLQMQGRFLYSGGFFAPNLFIFMDYFHRLLILFSPWFFVYVFTSVVKGRINSCSLDVYRLQALLFYGV